MLCLLLVLGLSSLVAAQEERNFETWLDELRQEALEAGISESSVELAFSEITPPVQRIISNDRAQPERVQTYEEYLSARVSEWKIRNGKSRMNSSERLCSRTEENTTVKRQNLFRSPEILSTLAVITECS